jgi:hypothetical protein
MVLAAEDPQRATDEFDFADFSRGLYVEAVEDK